LELIADSNEHSHHKLFVIGRDSKAEAHLAAQSALQTHCWEELEDAGSDVDIVLPSPSE
jgi:hypothetical protein